MAVILVGRDGELSRLTELLQRVSVVAVYGLPGVGKSALAQAFASRWNAPAWQEKLSAGAGLALALDRVRRRLSPTSEAASNEERIADIAGRLDAAGGLLVLDDLQALAPAD